MAFRWGGTTRPRKGEEIQKCGYAKRLRQTVDPTAGAARAQKQPRGLTPFLLPRCDRCAFLPRLPGGELESYKSFQTERAKSGKKRGKKENGDAGWIEARARKKPTMSSGAPEREGHRTGTIQGDHAAGTRCARSQVEEASASGLRASEGACRTCGGRAARPRGQASTGGPPRERPAPQQEPQSGVLWRGSASGRESGAAPRMAGAAAGTAIGVLPAGQFAEERVDPGVGAGDTRSCKMVGRVHDFVK